MRTATECIVRDSADPQSAADLGENEIDLDGMTSFFWVWCAKRVASGTPASVATLRLNISEEEEGGGGSVTVNFDDPTNESVPSFVQTSVDGDALTVPDPATDMPNVGDISLRVVYGDVAEFDTSAENPRYLNTTNRVVGGRIVRCVAGLLFPQNWVQNMKYLGRARTDTGGIANDPDSPYTQTDERLFPEVCLLQADGTFYDASAF